jgi:hypothetical protein
VKLRGEDELGGDVVNIYPHNDSSEASYVPRESEDQLQAACKVPMAPRGQACTT